jgi:hypothetical protein
MLVIDQAAFDAHKMANPDPYGRGIIRFAEAWAELMEKRMGEGLNVEDVAKQASYDADTEGITGFMYGAAVAVLTKYWTFGEQLRRWHNIDTQIGDEGEKANESGGVLNPAMLSIGSK